MCARVCVGVVEWGVCVVASYCPVQPSELFVAGGRVYVVFYDEREERESHGGGPSIYCSGFLAASRVLSTFCLLSRRRLFWLSFCGASIQVGERKRNPYGTSAAVTRWPQVCCLSYRQHLESVVAGASERESDCGEITFCRGASVGARVLNSRLKRNVYMMLLVQRFVRRMMSVICLYR